MPVMDKRRRVQVDIPQTALNMLEDLAHEIRKFSDDRRVGTGTIAARLLESLSAHPEMIEQLLAEYARKAGTTAKTFHADETSGGRAHPKASGKR